MEKRPGQEVKQEAKQEIRRKYTHASNVAFVIDSIRQFDKPLLNLAVISAVFSAIGQFVPVFMPKSIIDQLTEGGTPGNIIMLVVVFSVIMLISECINKVVGNMLSSRFITVRLRLIARSGKKFMTTDFQNLENPAVLDLSRKGDRACDNNQDGIEGVMHRLLWLFSRVIVLIASSAIITMIHPVLLLIIATLLAFNFIITTRTKKLDKQANDALTKTQRKLQYMTNTMSDFSYGKDVRLFSMKKFLMPRYKDEQQHIFNGRMKIQQIWLRSKNVFAFTSLLQETVMYAWLCWQVLNGSISIGDFTMYIAAILKFSQAMRGILDDIAHIRQQHEVICDFRSFLDYPDLPSGMQKPPTYTNDNYCFEFENVSFRYPGREEYALQNLSLRIKAGERLAVVGLNGAGKSTFVKLLIRLYEPDEGKILLNGVDVRSYNKQEYWRLFSVVFQEIQLFAFTTAENVSMKEYAKTDMAQVASCVERAGLGPKILALPKGIDTAVFKVLDKDGIEFSGGERQKLALARALYKDRPVLVLDEPTASLDALAEVNLYKEFDTLTGKRTAVYISHRLASTRFCDRVAVFEGGRIIETGTHEQLITASGRYAELFSIQAEFYQKEAQPA